MNTSIGRVIAVGLAGLIAAPAGASASETVLGQTQAQACYEASHSDRKDRDAIAACDLALKDPLLQPKERGGAMVNRGVIRLRRSEWTEAQKDFDAAIELIPDVGEAWFNRGAAYIGERRYKDAVANFDQAISLGLKEPAKAYYYRGVAREYLDDAQGAYLDYQQSLVLAPDWDLPKHELKRFNVTRR